jgi:hypothetical protein
MISEAVTFKAQFFPCLPPVFVLAEDLGKSLSRLHQAICQIDGVTGLQQLGIPLMSLETIASTRKVSADEASPRNPPRSSLSHSYLRISEIAYAIGDLSLPAVSTGIWSWRLDRKTGGGQAIFSN